MALKDLKSDLSKFRMPKKEPLVNKKRESVKKKQNQTPLSSMLKSKPNLETSDKTPTKQGTKVNKFDNSSKFLGEANPSKFDNSSNFLGETKQTPMDNSSNFLGETDNVKFDNSSNFLGETNPNTFDNSSNFLGETNPNVFNNSSNFLGETTPNIFSNSSNFLGETNPNTFSNSSNFLGETNPNTFDNSPNFLGETTPTPVDFITNDKATGFTFNFKNKDNTKFVGVDPSNTIFDSTNSLHSNFLNSSNGISFSAGYDGFKPVGSFTGDTQRYNPDIKYSTDSFKELAIPSNGILAGQEGTRFINYNWIARASYARTNDFTTFRPGYGSFKFNTALPAPEYRGLTPGDTFHYTTDTHKLKQVDRGILQLQDGTGFIDNVWNTRASYAWSNDFTTFRPGYGSLKFQKNILAPKYNGLFVGDDFNYTTKESALSLKPKLKNVDRGIQNLQEPSFIQDLYNRDIDLAKFDFPEFNFKFRPGYQNFKSDTFIADSSPRFKYGDGNTYTTDGSALVPELGDADNNITNLSPLNQYYDKFHLKDDSPNFSYPNRAFQQPFILRGIQREGGEPEHYGQFGLSFDDGLIRGGVISSTVRAALDVARIGSWLLTPKGLVWQVKQLGLQLTNKFQQFWTPTNLLLSAGLQHLGLKPQRPGIIPFHDPLWSYERVIPDPMGSPNLFTNDKLWSIYTKDRVNTIVGTPFFMQTYFGGPKTFYGLGSTTTTRGDETFNLMLNPSKLNAGLHPLTNQIQWVKGQSLPMFQKITPMATDAGIFDDEGKKYSAKNAIETKTGVSYPEKGTIDDKMKFGLAGTQDSLNSIGQRGLFNIFGTLDTIEDIEGLKNDNHGNPLAKSALGLPKTIQVPLMGNIKVAGSITDYETVAYGKIPDTRRGSTIPHDFRSLLTGEGKISAESANYTKNNIQGQRFFGNPGKIGLDRSQWWVDLKETYDEVNANPIEDNTEDLDSIPKNIKKDLVHLWFKAYGKDNTMHKTVQFRCTVTGLQDTFSPNWDSIKYNGRADQAYQYSTFSRSVGFNFKVIATSRQEMKPIWEKLQYLASMTMPEYQGRNGYHGTLVRFRLGDLYGGAGHSKGRLCFISALSYTMMDETPWEINDLAHKEDKIGELPMGVSVSITLTILDDFNQPSVGAKLYDWDFKTPVQTQQETNAKDVDAANYQASPAGQAATKRRLDEIALPYIVTPKFTNPLS